MRKSASIPSTGNASSYWKRQVPQADFEQHSAVLSEAEAWSSESKAMIDRTIHYMNEKFAEGMTRQKLSSIAGMSLWHYSHQFKHWVGQSPIDYLNSIRINKAKEQLLYSNLRIKEIAEKVGFEDEFYFSRKFKKAAGITPKQYAKWTTTRIASFSFPYAGHLLALGIVPCSTLVDPQRDVHRHAFFQHIPYPLRRSKRMEPDLVDYNRRTLQQARPELILCDDMVNEQIISSIGKIARTVIIPWLDLDWRQQFRQIAALLGKGALVEGWLAKYEQKAACTGARIRELFQEDTISYIHLMQGHIVVYGRRNGGAVLYEDLQLNCPYKLDDISIMHEIEQQELPAYTGDRLLLIVDSDPASQQMWLRLQHSSVWRQLKAVKTGNVRQILECPWLDYSPYAHNLMVDQLEELFQRN
ncbi:AraC family transcriptional regulator [Paenibacillus sp. KS-LC4]|uniref:AraC family transcriptional regulator n=1 Tax=Paenibacillus sp. KS-LC4 TaxID=2979727 RepID=UPI0030CBCE72